MNPRLGMTAESWNRLSEWHTAWLAAGLVERQRLRAQLARDHPELVAQAEELAEASVDLPGFLETPAFVLAAPSLAGEEPLLAVDSMVGPYRIVGLVARGGMGEVYRATDVRLHRDVALKVLAPGDAADTQRVERFVQEARVTASLDHPNIVRLYDVGLVDGRPYFVAELLEGETLRARVARGPLSVEDVLRIGSGVARGLGAAHAAGSVHRDLKPENLFLTGSGVTKILDFGIAKLTHDGRTRDGLSTLTGIVLGTAGYLAPEQIRGGEVDGRADLFALGAILFEALTGRRAFAREHTVDTLHAILHEAAPDPAESRDDVPPALAGIVSRLLEKSPAARFQSAAELGAALDAVAGSPRLAAEAGARSRRWRTALRRAWPAPIVGALVVVLALAAAWVYRHPGPASDMPATRLAILPFRSLPESADGQLLELGLAEILISRLTQLSEIRVLPLSAAERLRGTDPRDAGRKLEVDRVLTGTVQREQNRVRASVQLLAIPDGRAIWSATIDSDGASVFAIQDAIVTRVLREVAPQLAVDARARLVEPGTRNGEAYQSYLRGRAHAAQVTGADFSRAADAFRHAVALDPGYADGWAALGAALRRLPIAGEVHPEGPFTEARRAALRALELAPGHAEALAVLGTVAFWYDWDYPRAEELLRLAITRQPSADSQYLLAHLLSHLGRHDEALVEVRRARELDPEALLPRAIEGSFLFASRRYPEAIAHLDSVVELAPNFVQGHVMRGIVLASLDRYDEAIRECDIADELEARIQRSASVGPRLFPTALRGYALARSGRRAEAEAVLRRMRARERVAYVPPHDIAMVLHGLGREDEALEELRRAVDVRDVRVTRLGVDPKWDELRGSAAFQAQLSRIHLLDVSNRVLAGR